MYVNDTAIIGVSTLVTGQSRVCTMPASFKEVFAQYKKQKARLKAQQAERRACSKPSISEAEQVLPKKSRHTHQALHQYCLAGMLVRVHIWHEAQCAEVSWALHAP